MIGYLLDTSALLTLREDELGSEQVADLLYSAKSRNIQCFLTLSGYGFIFFD